MWRIFSLRARVHKIISIVIIASILAVSSAFAQTAPKTYAVELVVVTEEKKSVETDADLTFNEETFTVVPDKMTFNSSSKNLAYADVKVADHSYSKKPMLSGGGALATALLLSVFLAVPLLFIKKKKHWMTIQTEKEFVVLKLGDRNFRQIMAEFETHGVKVNDLGEEKKK